jgi:hypothetical protein
MINTHHPRPRRRLAAVLGVATSIIALGTIAPSAHADGLEASEHFQKVFGQFTDCPALPTSGTVTCTATEVQGFLDRISVDDRHQPTDLSNHAFVRVYDVTLTPGGFTASVRSRALVPARVKIDGTEGGHVSGSATLDDGTTTTFDVVWRAVGPTSKFSGPFDLDNALCPSGEMTGQFRSRVRDAITTGSVVTNGVAEVATSAANTPFIVDETDTGQCV